MESAAIEVAPAVNTIPKTRTCQNFVIRFSLEKAFQDDRQPEHDTEDGCPFSAPGAVTSSLFDAIVTFRGE
jgi:hypothetical protein